MRQDEVLIVDSVGIFKMIVNDRSISSSQISEIDQKCLKMGFRDILESVCRYQNV
jgi:hypothetical protein